MGEIMQTTLLDLGNKFSGKYYKSGHFVDNEEFNFLVWSDRFWRTLNTIDERKKIPIFRIIRGFQFDFKDEDDEGWVIDFIDFTKREEAEDFLDSEVGNSEFLREKNLCLDWRERYTHKVVKEGKYYVKGERVI